MRINIPESLQPEPLLHLDSESNNPSRSPMRRLPPRTHMTFTPSTPSSPAPPLPSRTSPDNAARNSIIHHSLTKRTELFGPQPGTDEFGVDSRSPPPPRHYSLNSRPQSVAAFGKPAPPPPPRPVSLVSSELPNSSPSLATVGSLISAPPPLPNRRSNPNLRAEEPPSVTVTSNSAPPAPPIATRPSPSSAWNKLAASTKLPSFKNLQSAPADQDAASFKPPPPPTRVIAPGDKLPPPRRQSGDDSSDSGLDEDTQTGQTPATSTSRKFQDDMPDSSQSHRRPPTLSSYLPVPVPSHGAVVAMSGFWVCVAHATVEIYDIRKMPSPQFSIELDRLHLDWRAKEPRITAMEFRPGDTREEDGRFLWCGAKDGHLLELDIWSGNVTEFLAPAAGHGLTVLHILRYGSSMFTMDESGKVIVFDPPENHHSPTLLRFTRSHRVAEKQSFAKILGGHLWTSYGSGGTSTNHNARGTPFRTYDISSSTFATKHSFPSEPVGPALCGAVIPDQPDLIYIGHEGGSLTIWKHDASTGQHVCVQTIKISASSIICMEGVGSRLWFGTRSGLITVCETRENSPWLVTNQWQAHGDSPVAHIAVDPYSISKVRFQVSTINQVTQTFLLRLGDSWYIAWGETIECYSGMAL